MNREEKKAKKLERAFNRRKKRIDRINKLNLLCREYGCTIQRAAVIDSDGPHAPWRDLNSPTGWYQNCSYQGICEYPCNGDC